MLQRVFRAADPDTVIHAASIIDLRPKPSPLLQQVNVKATRELIHLCKSLITEAHGHRLVKFVYVSSLETAATGPNGLSILDAVEEEPYPKPTNGYMRTKIEAEKLVLAANETHHPDMGLKTVSIRPAHIFGQGDDLFSTAVVPIGFGKDIKGEKWGAQMSMVNVENCAFAMLIGATQLSPGPKLVSTRL